MVKREGLISPDDRHRDNRHSSFDGQKNRTSLELHERTGLSSTTLREDDQTASAAKLFRGDAEGLAIGPVDIDRK